MKPSPWALWHVDALSHSSQARPGSTMPFPRLLLRLPAAGAQQLPHNSFQSRRAQICRQHGQQQAARASTASLYRPGEAASWPTHGHERLNGEGSGGRGGAQASFIEIELMMLGCLGQPRRVRKLGAQLTGGCAHFARRTLSAMAREFEWALCFNGLNKMSKRICSRPLSQVLEATSQTSWLVRGSISLSLTCSCRGISQARPGSPKLHHNRP